MTRNERRARVISLFKAAIAAADPARAVRRELTTRPLPRPGSGRLLVVALGKAAGAMMSETLKHVVAGANVRALAVTNYENATEIDGCTVFAAGHPEPDENGHKAARAVTDFMTGAGADDRVLCLISGGGSALLPAPRAGISLGDKIATNAILLSHSFDITEINLVRQQLSTLKGGGLARLAAPAPVRSLIISDVIGDDLSAIASGPTSPPLGTPEDAVRLLKSREIWPHLPQPVRSLLDAAKPPAGLLGGQINSLVCSNNQSLRAVAAAATGISARIVTDRLSGDVRDAADTIAAVILNDPAAPRLLIWGGETTVTLRGNGVGGRNQELALHVARRLGALKGDWVFLSGGTDGRDGPTDAAGGLVDNETLSRLQRAGVDLDAKLADNDSYHALKSSADLLMTGPTGTNVADVQIFLSDGAAP